MLVRSSAQSRFLSIPPKKMRLVAGLVKGLRVERALAILNFTPRIAARHLAKTLKSAAANALSKEGTDHLSAEALTVKNIVVDAAPTAKRIRFRSMGRVYRYRKRFCHLLVELEGETDVPTERKAAGGKAAGGKAAAKESPSAKTAKGRSAAKKTSTAKGKPSKAVSKTRASKTGAEKPSGRKKTGRPKAGEKNDAGK
jgi:large subunit ribosomal protein L22